MGAGPSKGSRRADERDAPTSPVGGDKARPNASSRDD
jgi:hypothetical protein